MLKPNVAVVVPVYNRATVVVHTLDSIARQSRLPDMLLIVDDGSTDGTPESVHRWIQSRSGQLPAELVEQANQGAAAARNNGLTRIGDCKMVAFLDSDDLWPRDFLARTVACLQQSPEAVAASCDRAFVDADGNVFRRDDLAAINGHATRWLFQHDGGIASCSLFRTALIRRLGGFDQRLATGHDSELFLRLSLLGDWLYTAGEPVVFQCSLSSERGEQTRISETYDDCHRRWAHVHEDFIDLRDGRRALPATLYRDRLARRWYWAGRQLMMSGRNQEARDCFRRSLAWKPWKTKTWLRLFRTFLPSKLVRAA